MAEDQMRTTLRAASGLALAALAAIASADGPASNPTPSPPVSRAPTPDPRRPIILRDDWGVPHIYAADEADGFFALGYAQAEDALPQILRYYLGVLGRSAEVFGTDALDTDIDALRWEHLAQARLGLARLNSALLVDYSSYLDGIRSYMKSHPNEVPAWAPELEPAMIVALGRQLVWAYDIGDGLLACQRARAIRSSQISSPGNLANAEQHASNEWILAPARTANHALIHLTDPHGPFGGFISPYEFRIHAGRFQMAGFTNIGLALPLLGHSDRVAIAWTTGGPVTSDCFAFSRAAHTSNGYTVSSKLSHLSGKTHVFKVFHAPSAIRHFQYATAMGISSPVIAQDESYFYTVMSPYMDTAGLFDEQIYRQDLARDVDEFWNAMHIQGMFAQNVMIGDSSGHSLYVRAGRTPIRPVGVDVEKPIVASLQTAWLGIHPLEDLVQVRDPSSGFMSNDNVAPDQTTQSGEIDGSRFPSYIFNDTIGRQNTRGRRMLELAGGVGGVTVSQAIDIALDEKWWGTESWQLALRTALHAPGANASVAGPFTALILSFDGFASKDSSAATAYMAWRESIVENAPRLGMNIDTLSDAVESRHPLDADTLRLLADSAAQASAHVPRSSDGSVKTLGEQCHIGRTERDSLSIGGYGFLAGPPVPDAIFAASGLFRRAVIPIRAMRCETINHGGTRMAVYGQRQPMLTIFSTPIQSYSAVAYGQSSREKDAHFNDQTVLASERRLKSTYFNWEDLATHIAHREQLVR